MVQDFLLFCNRFFFPENADNAHNQLDSVGDQHRIVADQQIVYHPAAGISCFKNLELFGCGLHQTESIENNTGKRKYIPQGFKGEHRPYCVDPQKHPGHNPGLFLFPRQEKHNHRLDDRQNHHTGTGDTAGKTEVDDVLSAFKNGGEAADEFVGVYLRGSRLGAVCHSLIEFIEGHRLTQIVRVFHAVKIVMEENTVYSALFKVLLRQIRRKLKPLGEFRVFTSQSTVFVEAEDDALLDLALPRLETVFGIVSLSVAFCAEKNMDAILETVRAKAILTGFQQKVAAEELCRKCGYARRFG